MTKTLGYSTDGETVTLTMTRDDYANLLLHLGFAAGSQVRYGNSLFLNRCLALANRLNVGNPNWTPYEIPPPDGVPETRGEPQDVN